MSARRAVVFVCVAAILAGLFVLASAGLSRLMATAGPERVIDVAADSIALPLDAQGLGAQVIEGAIYTIRVQPYPPLARLPVTVSLVVISADGRLPVFSPSVAVSAPDSTPGVGAPMRRLASGGYEYSGALFPAAGAYRLTVDAPVAPGAEYAIPIDITVR